jgi:flagellar basal-body rod protein FlgB
MLRMIQSLEFQSQALVLRSERQRLLASNIANADTPGYVARDMDFRRALLAAARKADATATIAGGASAQPSSGADGTGPGVTDDELVYGLYSQDGIDNNKVDMERERASWVENSVKYEATLRFINLQARALMDAMKSPTQG